MKNVNVIKQGDVMTSRERFFATLDRKPVDYPASWLGIPADSALPALFAHFGVSDLKGLKTAIGDDIWPVEVPYNHPPANHVACAFDFAKQDCNISIEERTLTAPGFFEDMTDPACVDDFDWPNPADHIDPEACLRAVEEAPEDVIRLGVLWAAHFQDVCAAFGMTNALITMLTAPEMFQAVLDRIVDFYLKAADIFYEATKGKLDAVLIGNDFGSQSGLMVAPDQLREFAMPGSRKIIAQAKKHGLRVIYHSCGAVREIIPDLVEIGTDCVHPIQALAVGMEPQGLKNDFGNLTTFCGGVDAQNLLVHGSPEDVRAKVRELKKIFPTGLIISPSHEAILPDIPPANVEALFQAVRES
jgi:uroporphyrinogen decarboxylase